MQFGKVFIAKRLFKYNQKKSFFKILKDGKYRGNFEEAWKEYRK